MLQHWWIGPGWQKVAAAAPVMLLLVLNTPFQEATSLIK